MAYDGIVLRAVTHELETALLGGRVDKIHQPLERDLLLQIRNRGKNYRLLLSAHPAFPRVHLAEHYQAQNPLEPPMFCMLLRKHLEGGRIVSIRQVGNERILIIAVENRDELGDLTERHLVVEIMGRHSNIILLDASEQRILDAIVHVNVSTSRYREVLPGRRYVAPPDQRKTNPLDAAREDFLRMRREDQGLSFDQFLVQKYSGISPLAGKEIAFRAASADPSDEWETFHSVVEAVRQHRYEPTIVWDENGKPLAFSAIPLTHLSGRREQMGGISRCIETFYQEKSWRDALKQKAGDIERVLQTEITKNKGKLQKFKEAIEDAKKAERYRLFGELITAHLYQLEKGLSEARLPNFYEETMKEVTIPLDPSLSPLENAQAYFRKYNKGKKSVPVLEEQIRRTEEEIDYLENVREQLRFAGWEDLDDIREELEQEGYLKKKRKNKTAKKQAPARPEHYRSSDGTDIYVGKNNRQNDYLTMKLAASTDTWLHTKDLPGSHVVIRGKNPSETTLYEAANLAAYFSKGRESSQVPVDYTLIKHVWKPNGAKPGFVLYEKQKTIYVTPDAELVKRMKVSAQEQAKKRD
jgi:predicted ribosome quality control (RQC) complex YloA/Tae2 family protein